MTENPDDDYYDNDENSYFWIMEWNRLMFLLSSGC